MPTTIQSQPRTATETTALLKLSTSTSITSSISSSSSNSFSELSVISTINTFCIKRYKKRICCNCTRQYHVLDPEDRLLLTASQDVGCWSDDHEDLLIYDFQEDQVMFGVEYEERTGYLSTQMKFSVVSSTKLGMGSVQRVWSFMDAPRYEILNWNGEHLYSIGPPTISGIKSYDYKRKYEVLSNNGRPAAILVQEGRTVTLKFEEKESLHVRDKTLILALGFILDVLRNEEI